MVIPNGVADAVDEEEDGPTILELKALQLAPMARRTKMAILFLVIPMASMMVMVPSRRSILMAPPTDADADVVHAVKA